MLNFTICTERITLPDLLEAVIANKNECPKDSECNKTSNKINGSAIAHKFCNERHETYLVIRKKFIINYYVYKLMSEKIASLKDKSGSRERENITVVIAYKLLGLTKDEQLIDRYATFEKKCYVSWKTIHDYLKGLVDQCCIKMPKTVGIKALTGGLDTSKFFLPEYDKTEELLYNPK